MNKKGITELGLALATTAIILLTIFIIGSIRLDFAKGSHRITPTAVDTDFWGNYIVYYRTSVYQNSYQDEHYYIDKNSPELAQKMEEYVTTGEEVIVYYDKFVGWKGFSAPSSSPIIRIEEVK